MSVYLSSKYSKCLDFRPYRDRDKSGQSSKVSFESSETKNYLAVWPCLVIVWLKLVDKILYGSGLALIFALLWKSHGKARVVVSLRLAMAVGSKTPLDFCIAVGLFVPPEGIPVDLQHRHRPREKKAERKESM